MADRRTDFFRQRRLRYAQHRAVTNEHIQRNAE